MTKPTKLIKLDEISDMFREVLEGSLTRLGVEMDEVEHIVALSTRAASFKVVLKDGTARFL